MDALLKNTGFTCRYEAEHIVITPVEQKTEKAAAGQATQMKKITGKVTGVTGEPLIGANVLAVGGKQATITNLEGEFSLEVSGYLYRLFASGGQYQWKNSFRHSVERRFTIDG